LRRGQIAQLDGVRALAVLAVMTFHAFLTGWGYLGVDVFFVLSGLLITSILVGEWEARDHVDLRRFWERRLLRLYPGLLTMLVLCSLVGSHLSLDGTWQNWWDSLFVSATYTANVAILVDGTQFLGALGPLWSLAVEMQFYLLWPFALVFLLRRRISRLALTIGVSVLSLVLLSEFWLLGPQARPELAVAPSYFRPDSRFGELLAGCALALALSMRRGPLSRRADWGLSALAVVGLALVVLAYRLLYKHGTVSPMPLVAVGTALVLARLATSDSAVLSRLLRIPPLPYIGRISYAMYLWQLPIFTLSIWWATDSHKTLQRILYWGGTIVVAALSTELIERRFTKRGARLRVTEAEAGLGDREGQGSARGGTAGEAAHVADRTPA
jgi:peptidoglycan/LPS O-acetylase OafA/YrhL